MNKIALIIQREYLTRVRKRAFIVMTILGPMLFGGFITMLGWLTQVEDNEDKIIVVVECDKMDEPVPDSLSVFKDVIPDKEHLKFEYVCAPLDVLKISLPHSNYYGILYIPYNIVNSETAQLFTKKQPSLNVEVHITKYLENYIHNLKLRKKNISVDVLNAVQTNINLKTSKLNKDGDFQVQELQDLKATISFISGFLIYFFIFFFGAQVMRGVSEEKNNRIVEVIVSSVKPFQLMMGKIIGIGLIGLTQFLVWIILTFGITAVAQQAFGINKNPSTDELAPVSIFQAQPSVGKTIPNANVATNEFEEYFDRINSIDFFTIIMCFIFYFIGGFVLYGSLFAAIGSIVDNETDTQQFILPVTIPLLFSFMILINTLTNPDGRLAEIFSIIPLTSPVVMMGRIGFEIPYTQVVLSMVLLIVTFLATTWLAGKIYRTGILMYGKKVTYKELWKWIKYKN